MAAVWKTEELGWQSQSWWEQVETEKLGPRSRIAISR